MGKRIYINVELTNYSTPWDELPERVVELVREYKLGDQVIFSSFNPLNLIWITKLLPKAAIGLLAWKGFQSFFVRSVMGKWVSDKIIHIHKEDAYNSDIHRQHEMGRRVHVWTVNAQHEMRRLFSQKIDGIFTDAPFLACQTLEVH